MRFRWNGNGVELIGNTGGRVSRLPSGLRVPVRSTEARCVRHGGATSAAGGSGSGTAVAAVTAARCPAFGYDHVIVDPHITVSVSRASKFVVAYAHRCPTVPDRLRRPLLAADRPPAPADLRAALHTIDTRHQRHRHSATHRSLKTHDNSTSVGEHAPLRRCPDVAPAAGPLPGRGSGAAAVAAAAVGSAVRGIAAEAADPAAVVAH